MAHVLVRPWLHRWGGVRCRVDCVLDSKMYYVMKTLFLLYLALPQTRGSSYIYINHLQPFLHSHESQIDATLASFKARLYTFMHERFRAVWDSFVGALGQQQQAQYAAGAGGIGVAAPPSLGDPVSGPAQLVAGLWRSYGPGLLASGAALLSQGAAASGSAADKAWRTPAGSQIHLDPTQPTRDRKLRKRRAEPQSQSKPVAGSFEEGEEQSDAEGYDVDGNGKGSEHVARSTNWFGWGSSGTKEKSD